MSDFQKLKQIIKKTRLEKDLNSDPKAFVYLCVKYFLKLPPEKISESITHGKHDGGIDAVHIDDEGIHIVACDYSKNKLGSKSPIPKKRLERFISTWLAIASSNDEELSINEVLRRKLDEIKSSWARFESGYIPHIFYFFTNREYDGIPRKETERRMNYYMMHTYHYFEQEEIAEALLDLKEE